MKSKIDPRTQSCGHQVTTLQLTVRDRRNSKSVVQYGSDENMVLIDYPSKAENQCFSYPLSSKSKWTCSLVPNILGKLSSVDAVEFHFSDLPLFLPFMKQYAFTQCTIHQCLISNKLCCYILNKNLTFHWTDNSFFKRSCHNVCRVHCSSIGLHLSFFVAFVMEPY